MKVFIGTLVISLVIMIFIALICASVASGKTYIYRKKESFIKEFFDFLWIPMFTMISMTAYAFLFVFLFGIVISIFTLGIVDGFEFLLDIIVYLEKIVKGIWWLLFVITEMTTVSSGFEDSPCDYSGSSYSNDYPRTRKYTVDEPNNPYRILPIEYTERDEGDRIIVTKFDYHNPKIIDDKYIIKKK